MFPRSSQQTFLSWEGKWGELVEKVTFSHFTKPFQCQTFQLCPLHHIWRKKIYISHVPPTEHIICILTHCTCLTHTHTHTLHISACRYTWIDHTCIGLFSFKHTLHLSSLWATLFPSQLMEHAGRVVGYVKRHCVASTVGCRKLHLAAGPDARWGQTLPTNTRRRLQTSRHVSAPYLCVCECVCDRLSFQLC